LSGEVLKDDDESMSTKLLEVAAVALPTNDDGKSSQSKKTSGKSGTAKRKLSASASSNKTSSTPTKHRKMLSKHAKKPKARAEIDAETCSEHSLSHIFYLGRRRQNATNIHSVLNALSDLPK
jgi:hypothetical protein